MATIFSRLFGPSDDLKAVYEQGAIILDVRTPQEFRSGHIKGAIHIPVDQLDRRTPELRQMNKPVIACCASGMRSGTAKRILAAAGIEAYNGGDWQTLEYKLKVS